MRVEHFLSRSAREWPCKVALITGEGRWTYAELEAMSNQVAHGLTHLGVNRGDRVVLCLENSVTAVVSLFGVLKSGGVASLIHPTTKTRKLSYILDHSDARVVITQASLLPIVRPATRAIPSVIATLVAGGTRDGGADERPLDVLMQGASCAPHESGGIETDLAFLIYTSGSTGTPKGVMMTHRNVLSASTSITEYLENRSEDVIFCALPLSFDYGLYQILMAFQVGGTVVLEKSFTYPQSALKRLAEEQVTGFPLVPTMAAVLLGLKGLVPGRFPHLRYLTNTAAALPPSHIARLQELFPTTRIYSMYGLTECKRCTYLPPEQISLRPESVGKAIPNTEVYILDEQGNRVGPGEIGELVVRGPHVMQGYWKDPEATAQVLRPGDHPWERVLHTGDLFRMDEEGYLYFVGRRDDIIKTRGEKVSPKEIENVLYSLPGVREAAVVGLPDPILGQKIQAIVVPEDGATLSERDIVLGCAAHLESFMVPQIVEFRAELPKTDSGKIRKGVACLCSEGGSRDG